MTSIIKNAAAGQKKALETLYHSVEKKVFFLACSLLGDEKEAVNASVQAFKSAFESLKNEGIETEKDFSDLVIKKLANNCKKIITKKDQKAFKIPANKNFVLTGAVDTDCNNTELADRILDRFAFVQKTVLVLDIVGGLDKKQIAAICKTDVKTVEAAIDAQNGNIERLSDGKMTLENISDTFRKRENAISLPREANDEIKKIIAEISAPYKKRRRNIAIIITSIVLVVCLIATGVIIHNLNNQPQEYEEGAIYTAEIEVEKYGTIKLELDSNVAPITVKNFVSLANSGFYDGLTFHRIISGFMIQGGDPDGNGMGGSDEEIFGEFSENGWENNLLHKRGVISMARSEKPNSASSQFFIMHKDAPHLDGKYAAFGWVTDGIEVVDEICEKAADPVDGNGLIHPDHQPRIKTIKITGTK